MKLEVGDIKMDSDGGIQIGTANSAHQQTLTRVTKQPTSLTVNDQDQIWTTAMSVPVLGMAIIAMAALLLIVSGQPWWLVALLFFTLQVPAALFLLRARQNALTARQAQTDSESFLIDQKRLMKWLSQTEVPRSVSQICDHLALPEEKVLGLVTNLLESQDLDEDVDLETGHFVYTTAPKLVIDPDHKSASERIKELQKTQQQPAISKELK